MTVLFPAVISKGEAVLQLEELLESSQFPEAAKLVMNPRSPLYAWHTIVTLASEDSEMDRFFDQDPLLNAFWAKRLGEKKYPDFSWPQTDGKKITLFQRFKGVYHWGQYLAARQPYSQSPPDKKVLAELDAACEGHLYDAYQEKIRLLTTQLLNNDDTVIDQLLNTLNQFAVSFWSIGYLYAAGTLVMIAAWMKDRDDHPPGVYATAGLLQLYTGYHLRDHPVSEALIKSTFGEAGLSKLFENYIAASAPANFDSLEKVFFGMLGNLFKLNDLIVFKNDYSRFGKENARRIEAIVPRKEIMKEEEKNSEEEGELILSESSPFRSRGPVRA